MRINWTLITIPVLITLSFWLMDGLVNDWGRLSGGGQNLIFSSMNHYGHQIGEF